MLYNFIGFIVISLRCNLYDVLSLASTGNDVILRQCTCFRTFHGLHGSLVKENHKMYKVCMFKLSQLSKFLHGRRRKKLLSKFRTKSSVNTSIASRFHPTVVAALKSRAASKDKSSPGFLTAGSIASIYVHT